MSSRVAMAVIGIVLIGGAGGAAGVLSAQRPPSAGTPVVQTDATATPVNNPATSTATAPTATDTPVQATPTRPRPTPTATPSRQAGSTASLSGHIHTQPNTSNQTFVIANTTIHVDSKTQYTNSQRTSFSTLQINDIVQVTGVWRADGSVLATTVNAQPDN